MNGGQNFHFKYVIRMISVKFQHWIVYKSKTETRVTSNGLGLSQTWTVTPFWGIDVHWKCSGFQIMCCLFMKMFLELNLFVVIDGTSLFMSLLNVNIL